MALTVVSVVFGVFAVGLIVLLIYKSTLTMHEDDQIKFLDDANSHMQGEQTELRGQVNRLATSWCVSSASAREYFCWCWWRC